MAMDGDLAAALDEALDAAPLGGKKGARPSRYRRRPATEAVALRDGAGKAKARGKRPVMEAISERPAGTFGRLPAALVQFVLRRLSAEDVCSAAQACKMLSCACADEAIWRALYTLRWGKSTTDRETAATEVAEALDGDFENTPPSRKRARGPAEASTSRAGAASPSMTEHARWRTLYQRRDAKESATMMQGVAPELCEQFRGIVAARRAETPPLPGTPVAAGGLGKSVERDTLKERVARWRREHGLSASVCPTHRCTKKCKFVAMHGAAFLCVATGKLHTCGPNCDALEHDEERCEAVCPLTGYCTTLMFQAGTRRGLEEEEEDVLNDWR